MNVRLAALSLRRSLHPIVLAACATALVLGAWTSTADTLPIERGARAGLQLESAWSTVVAFVGVAFVAVAAARVASRTPDDATWLATSRAGSFAQFTAHWCGAATGALAVVAISALVIGARADDGSTRLGEPRGSLALPPGDLLRAGRPLEWTATIDSAIEPLRAEVDVGFGTAGDAGTLVLAAERGGSRTESRVRVGARERVAVDVPRGAGPVHFTLSIADGADVARIHGGAATLWADGPTRRGASARIAASTWIALVAAAALALGLAAWMRASLATLVVIAAWIASASALEPSAWIPGARIAASLELLGLDRAPPPFDPRALVGLAACVAVGALLATRRRRARA